jgi:hypothetical protein
MIMILLKQTRPSQKILTYNYLKNCGTYPVSDIISNSPNGVPTGNTVAFRFLLKIGKAGIYSPLGNILLWY